MIWEDTEGVLEQLESKEKFGIFWSMGNGKTALMLALCDYKFFQDVKKVLIITPKQVSLSTWQNEINKWQNFEYMASVLKLIEGTESERNKKLDSTGEFCIHIISSSLTEWLYGKQVRNGKRIEWELNKHKPDYDMIIVDECSQFKDTTTRRFKALRKLAPKYLFLLSGTPFSNIIKDEKIKTSISYENADELYYVFNLLDIYDKSLTQFRNEFCYVFPWDKYNYRMTDTAYNLLIETLNQYCIRKKLTLDIKKNEYKIYNEIDYNRIKTLKDDFYIETDGFKTITASNTATMINKALQLSNGFVYDSKGIPERINTYKFNSLLELLINTDDNVIIFYNFKEDKEYLLKNINDARELINDNDIKDWNAGKIKYLILSPFSSKYGLNLQQGGHTIVWYGLVWSAESYEQANARLYRRGQTKDVNIYYLLSKRSFDDYVYNKLVSKTEVINDFISYAENI